MQNIKVLINFIIFFKELNFKDDDRSDEGGGQPDSSFRKVYVWYLLTNDSLECIKNSDVKVSHKYTLGDLTMQTFCVRFDPNDKYIAAGIMPS